MASIVVNPTSKHVSSVDPNHQKRRGALKASLGEKTYKLSTFSDQLEAKPGDTIKVRVPKLTWNSDECIIPESFCLEFNFDCSNTKSIFNNNLSRLLVKHLQIRLGDEIVYDNTQESTLNLYRDLWLPSHERQGMVRYGFGSLNLRKLMSGSDDGSTSTAIDGVTDKLISDMHKSLKIRLGQILENHGPYSPGNMNLVVEYQITLPSSSEIMTPQSSQTLGEYKLTNLKYGYVSIRNREMVEEVMSHYAGSGKEISYINAKVEETKEWDKDSTEEIINIRASRKTLTCIVGLFRYTDQNEDEDFIYPNIDEVKIELNGDPNKLFSRGMTKNEIYEEAKKLFGVDFSDVSFYKFFSSRFALVLDFRTVSHASLYGSGVNTENGGRVHLIIKRRATSKNVKCTFYTLSDAVAIVSINDLLRYVK